MAEFRTLKIKPSVWTSQTQSHYWTEGKGFSQQLRIHHTLLFGYHFYFPLSLRLKCPKRVLSNVPIWVLPLEQNKPEAEKEGGEGMWDRPPPVSAFSPGGHMEGVFKKPGTAFSFKWVGIKVGKWEGQGSFQF